MDTSRSQTPVGSRRAIRRAVALGCEVISTRNDRPVRYRATDVSVGGIWLQTVDPVRTGETVVVCFRPEDGISRELLVFASVARVMTARDATDDTPGVGMGLELLDLATSERERLDRWLANHQLPVPRRRRPVARHDALPLGATATLAPPSRLPSCWR